MRTRRRRRRHRWTTENRRSERRATEEAAPQRASEAANVTAWGRDALEGSRANREGRLRVLERGRVHGVHASWMVETARGDEERERATGLIYSLDGRLKQKIGKKVQSLERRCPHPEME